MALYHVAVYMKILNFHQIQTQNHYHEENQLYGCDRMLVLSFFLLKLNTLHIIAKSIFIFSCSEQRSLLLFIFM